MTTWTIPTPDELEARLGGLERLLTAKRWERASIVAAYVQPDLGNGGRDEPADFRHLQSARAFAARGLAGLTTPETVAEYARRWLEVRPRPQPGQPVDDDGLPPWRVPSPGTKYEPGQAVRRVQDQPGVVAVALADPAFAQKVVDRLPRDTKRDVLTTVHLSTLQDTAADNGSRVPRAGQDYNVDHPAADAVVAHVEAVGDIAALIDRLLPKMRALGPIGEDHDLAPRYFALQMAVAMALPSAPDRTH